MEQEKQEKTQLREAKKLYTENKKLIIEGKKNIKKCYLTSSSESRTSMNEVNDFEMKDVL